ncbi:MAG: aquaporin [Candidatus Saccharibacteria bacterium]
MATKPAISSTKKSAETKPKTSTIASKVDKYVPVNYEKICKTLRSVPMIGILVAEFIGTFLLTAAFIEMQANPLFVAFALAGVVLIVGGVSGAHVNPAVTIGAWATRKINWLRALGYIVVQLLGAVTAFLVLNTFLNGSAAPLTAAEIAGGATAPSLFTAASIVKDKEWYLFFAELLGVTILTLGVAAAVRSKRDRTFAAFAAGFAILIALYIAMSLTTVLLTAQGVSLSFLNPAIAFASNAFADVFAKGSAWNLWPIAIYVIAPALGGIVGFAIQDLFHCRNNDDCECGCDVCK